MTTKGKKRFLAKFLSALLIIGLLLNTAGTAALAEADESAETVRTTEIAEPEAKEPKQETAELPEGAGTQESAEPSEGTEEIMKLSSETGTKVGLEPEEETETQEVIKPTEAMTESVTEPAEAMTESAMEPAEATTESAAEPTEATTGAVEPEEAVTESAMEPREDRGTESVVEPIENPGIEVIPEENPAETLAVASETELMEETPEAVRAFLEAAKALPSPAQITPQNAEAIGGQVNAALDLWDALDETLGERDDVTEALETVYAVYEAVLGAEESVAEEEPALYATNGNKIPVGVGTTDQNVTKTAFITYDEWKKGGVAALGVSGDNADENRYGTVVVEPDGNTETVDCGNMTFYTYYGIAVSTNWKENGGLPWLMQCPSWLDCWFSADGGVLSIHFKAKPGAKAGQSGTVRVNYGASWVVVTNNGFEGEDNGKAIGDIYYNVTVGGEGSSVPEKPDAPDKNNITLKYVFVQCQDSTWDKANHSAPARLFYDGETTMEPGEVIENTSDDFDKNTYPYQCTVKLKGDFYVNLWNRSLAGRLGTHYLHSEPKDITFYYSAAEGKWKCPTASLTPFESSDTGKAYGWLVKITKKKPVEPDPVYYSVCYTDGVKGEIVFSDQVKMGLEVNAETPKFVMQADTVKENGDGTTT
ncbi:MAG: hypothetical protein HFI63_01525, partial [Lachnospiraceae bacterium]|nr:hypothetical protein [Lachnospiraceae bacterium]